MLLDYGGTLDGDAQHWFDHFVRLYAESGAPFSHAAIKAAFYAADTALPRLPAIATYGLEPMVRAHVALQMEQLRPEDPTLGATVIARFVADTRAAWERNRPMLGRLATRFRLGVVSNSYGNMPALLRDAALAPFEVVLDSALVGIAKPDPALYARAAADLRLPADAILHVGDSWERDVVPARAVGMHAAWLAGGAAPMPATPPDVPRLASLLELEALLA